VEGGPAALPRFSCDESILDFVRYEAMTHPAIRGAWYLEGRRQLDLMFGSGRRYRYSGVPAHIAHRFAAALSKGRFYNAEIRGRFLCSEIGGADLAEVA
jgi:hypothetical protein